MPIGLITDEKRQPLAVRKSRRRYTEKAFSLVKKSRAFFVRRPQHKRVRFVSGVQRSGTTLLMRILDLSWLTEVFHEHYAVAYEDSRLRDLSTLRKLVSQSGAPVVVFKALLDNFRLSDLLNQFDNSKALWAFRRYDDVVNSHLRKWPGGRNRIDQIVVDPSREGWRGQRMSADCLQTLRRLYKEGMNDATAQALFWYYRNQLFFDQNLHRSPNIMLFNYDAFVSSVEVESKRLGQFFSLPISARMSELVSTEAVSKHTTSDISPDVRAVCEQMYSSLLRCWENQRGVGSTFEGIDEIKT